MAWLEKLECCINVHNEGVRPIHPFADGRTYSQLDLDSYSQVVGLAKKYMGLEEASYLTNSIYYQLETQRQKDLGSVAIYTQIEPRGEPLYGFAFVADDCEFTPSLPN